MQEPAGGRGVSGEIAQISRPGCRARNVFDALLLLQKALILLTVSCPVGLGDLPYLLTPLCLRGHLGGLEPQLI